MPYTVTEPVLAKNLRKGQHTAIGEIDNVDRKTKFVYVTVVGTEKPLRLGLDENVMTEIEKLTDEEEAAEKAAYSLKAVEREILKADEAFAKAQAEMIKQLNGHVSMDHWRFSELAAAQTSKWIWDTVQKIAEKQEIGLVEAAKVMADDIRDKMIHVRFASRSGDTMANAVEDVENDVKLRFVDSLRWTIL